MKAAYYYSLTQQKLAKELNSKGVDICRYRFGEFVWEKVNPPYQQKTIEGKPYTEMKSHFEDDDEIPLKLANFDDSYLVHIKTGLPPCPITLKNLGIRIAKTI